MSLITFDETEGFFKMADRTVAMTTNILRTIALRSNYISAQALIIIVITNILFHYIQSG